MRNSHAMSCSLIGEVLFKSLANEQVVLLSEPPLLVTLVYLEALLQDFTSRVTARYLSLLYRLWWHPTSYQPSRQVKVHISGLYAAAGIEWKCVTSQTDCL